MKFTQAGTHFRVVARYTRQKNALFFQRRLPDKSFTHSEAISCAIAVLISVTRQQPELRFSVRLIHHVESALLC